MNVSLFKRMISKLFSRWSWWQESFGPGSSDDWRNPFWHLTEKNRITVIQSYQVWDLRIGFRKANSRRWIIWFFRHNIPWVPGTDANFYNAVFSFSRTRTIGKNSLGDPIERFRFNIIIRFFHSWWFAWGMGCLPDRGEFGWTGPWFFSFKGQAIANPGCIASGHEEGSV